MMMMKRRTNISELKPNYNQVKRELSVKGGFEMMIRNKNRGVKTEFIIVRGHIDNLPLIGRDTLIEQGMMILEPTGNLKETNELRIKRINGTNRNLQKN